MADEKNLELEELSAGAENAAKEDAKGGDEASWGSDVDPLEEREIVRSAADLSAVFDVPVNVSAVLGKSRMRVSALLKLGRGAVIELDRKVGEAVDIYVNDRLVARGEVVVIEDRLGITMTEIIKGDENQ